MDRKTHLAQEIEKSRSRLNRNFYLGSQKIDQKLRSLSRKLDALIVEYTRLGGK